MAFGITRQELMAWKREVSRGEIAFLTHYWLDDRFPGITTVTKVGCSDLDKLRLWCNHNGLDPNIFINVRPIRILILSATNRQKFYVSTA